jgi:hypothetical protein
VRRYGRIRPRAVTAAGALLAIACAGCASASSQGAAKHAGTGDRGATTAYLRARAKLIDSSESELPAGRGPTAAVVAAVRAGCPGVLRGTPANDLTVLARNGSVAEQRMQLVAASLLMEVEHSLEAAQREPQAAATRRFAETVASIRWSDPRINDLVHTFMQIEMERRDMPPVDICRQIREWSSSGYRKFRASTSAEPSGAIGRRWAFEMAALGCGQFSPVNPREVLRALRLFQQPGAVPTTRDIELSEIGLAFDELYAREAAARSLSQALGLSTTPRKRSKRGRHAPRLDAFPESAGCSGKPGLVSKEVQ